MEQVTNKTKKKKFYRWEIDIKFQFDIDLKFWALLPALNINTHFRGVEFEWLCFGIYINNPTNE